MSFGMGYVWASEKSLQSTRAGTSCSVYLQASTMFLALEEVRRTWLLSSTWPSERDPLRASHVENLCGIKPRDSFGSKSMSHVPLASRPKPRIPGNRRAKSADLEVGAGDLAKASGFWQKLGICFGKTGVF